jgi:hypothetical protein
MVPLSDAPDVDEQMMAAVATVTPGGQTPLADALHELARVGQLDDPQRDNILLVLTDGQPNCGCVAGDSDCVTSMAVAGVQALAGRSPAVDVDIIGFGTSAEEAHETLTAMAQAAGDASYYQANNVEELIGTLTEVAVSNVPCTFYLDELPEPDDLIVWLDDLPVAPCDAPACGDGYLYDQAAGTVELLGTTCDAIRDGEPHQVWFDSQQS